MKKKQLNERYGMIWEYTVNMIFANMVYFSVARKIKKYFGCPQNTFTENSYELNLQKKLF